MMSPVKSITHRYADELLDRPLAEYVAEQRADGVSWRRIALNLRDETDGEIDITYETLRSWFPDPEPAGATS